MPTLFDSHEEFNDWFSKDIESSAENKSQIDQSKILKYLLQRRSLMNKWLILEQISRLHMILKPFMLRRIKKDVENELTDKLEVLLYCPLTTRQKLLYMGLKKKIRFQYELIFLVLKFFQDIRSVIIWFLEVLMQIS